MKKPSGANRYLPIAYLALAVGLIATLIPSTLRPPQPQTNSSQAFSPDEPPDDQTLITELQRANSATAGAGIGEVTAPAALGVGPAANIGAGPPRACPHGFGTPPRQIESVYAAPCAAPFVGNNGGATYQGVTANEIRIAQIMCTNVMASKDGPVDDNATGGDAKDRTLRAFQRYFNSTYQFYGRRLQLISLNPKNGDTCNERAVKNKVVEAAEKYQAFGVIGDVGYVYGEAVRRKMVVEGHWTGGRPDYYTSKSPYMFSPTLDADQLIDANMEFACKQVVGKPAKYTDDPSIVGKPRKIGVVAWAGRDFGANGDVLQAEFKKKCGASFDSVVTVDTFDENDAQTVATIMTKFRAEGITTVLMFIDYVFGGQIANAATAQGYFPEWQLCGCMVWDTNIAIHFFVQSNQWRHAFGITAREVPRPGPETDWYRAYQQIDPDNEADETTGLVIFNALVHFANGIQMAGPRLTPQTFMQGLFKVPSRVPDPPWSVGGGFGPTDLTYPDYVGFAWWSATDLAPDDSNGTGAYRHVWNGKKFKIGEIPTEPIPFFEDGVTGLHGS